MKYLPITNNKNSWKAAISGAYLKLTTSCGLMVLWDGISTVRVSIPKTFGNMVTGLCGNCNGQKDDYRTSDGLDVSTRTEKFSLIGNSYLFRQEEMSTFR